MFEVQERLMREFLYQKCNTDKNTKRSLQQTKCNQEINKP